MMTRLLALFVAVLCSACAILPEHVEVNYMPDTAMVRTRVTAPIEVQISVADTRHAETPDWIADKKNGYGMRMASVLAQRPVADLVKDALA